MKSKLFSLIFLCFIFTFFFLSFKTFDIVTIFTLVEGGNHVFSLNGETIKIDDIYVQKHELTNAQLADILNWAYKQGYLEISKDEVYEVYQGKFLIYQLEQKYSGLIFAKDSFNVKKNFGNLPASYISWYGALAISNFLSIMGFIYSSNNFITALGVFVFKSVDLYSTLLSCVTYK